MLLGWNGVGGTQRQALKLARELQSLHVDVRILTVRETGLARREDVEQVAVDRVGWAASGTAAALSFLCGSFLWLLRRRNPRAILHAHTLPAALAAAVIRLVVEVPVIVKLPNAVTIDDFGGRRLGGLRWSLLRRQVSCFVALNESIARKLAERGVDPRRVAVIPNGVELPPCAIHDGVSRRTVRSALGLPRDAQIVLYLGRLVSDKGVDWLLDAWREVASRDSRHRLLIVGDGPDRDRLERLAACLGISDTVRFAGNQADVEPFLCAAEILVLPSRSEGMSNAVLEAMAHGLAVIATDVPGNRAVITAGLDGLLVPYGEPRRLCRCLLELLADPAVRTRLGTAARATVDARFAIRAVAGQYDRLYRGLRPDVKAGRRCA
jgi:glycosyltransferase involved in cell wall biosynthesis